MIIRYKFSILIIAALFFLWGCCKEPAPAPEAEMSLLIYLAGEDNTINQDIKDNIEQLKRGFIPQNGHIIIYHDAIGALPRLFTIVKEKDGSIVEKLIEEYPEENSADAAVLRRVLIKLRDDYPAKNYGLILSSHGTGWIPGPSSRSFPQLFKELLNERAQLNREDMPAVKSFGADKGYPGVQMEIDALAAAIPYRLSFILFDACLMGGIEVLYALRNATDYMVASPTEILSYGFPFEQIIQPIFMPKPDLESVINAFYNFYNEKSGLFRSATVAVYGTEEQALSELTQTVKSIFRANREKLDDFSPVDVQRYANLHPSDLPWFDLDDFILQLATTAEYERFQSALSKVVIYKRSTEGFFSAYTGGGYIQLKNFGGISTYIPYGTNGMHPVWRTAYKKTEWNQAVGLVE